MDRNDLITRVQRLRGRIYLQDGAIEGDSAHDGLHRAPQDAYSWHLLMQDSDGNVKGCVRAQIHDPDASIHKLAAYRAARTMDRHWGQKCRSALQEEMTLARRLNVPLLELGGLALDETVRGSSALVKMAGAIQSLAEHMGGAVAIGTVTCRHNTSRVLRRLGGRALEVRGDSLPSYYDPQYHCEMEILKFYSWMPSHHHNKYIHFSEHLVSSFLHRHFTPQTETGIGDLNPAFA